MSKQKKRKRIAGTRATGYSPPGANRAALMRPGRGNRPSPGPGQRAKLLGGLGSLLLLAGVLFVVNRWSANNPTVLASPAGQAQGQVVDGISCDTSEQVVSHIHAHLAVYTNDQSRIIPEGIGIVPPTRIVQTSAGPFVAAGRCFYWLHSDTPDGIIHVESPSQRVYTLGN